MAVITYKRSIRLSELSRGGWERAKREEGCSVTSIIEALGVLLAEGEHPIPDEVFQLARQIQNERDSRR